MSVLDADTDRMHRTAIQHTAEGFDRLIAWLGCFGDPADVPVAIERPDGRLVDRLLGAGHPVVPVKTNAIKAWRESETISGAKTARATPTSSPTTCACVTDLAQIEAGRDAVLALVRQPHGPQHRDQNTRPRGRGPPW